MAKEAFLFGYLPYCLQQRKDGSYLVLNRDLNPVGLRPANKLKIPMDDAGDRDRLPVDCTFTKLTPGNAAKISWCDSRDTTQVFLYSQDKPPTTSRKSMHDYLDRLGILADLNIKTVEVEVQT